MNRRVLVIGGVEDVLRPASRLGLDVIYVQRREAPVAVCPAHFRELHPASFDDHEGMVRLAEEIHRRAPLDSVISFSELGLIPAALVGERLGLPGASPVRTARLLRDKLAMRQELACHGLSPVPAGFCTTLDEAREFSGQVGYPVILKPRDGTGSAAVHRVNSPAGLAPAVTASLGAHPDGFLVERFLSGTELSIEAFSFGGRHLIAALTQKQVTANYVECGHVVPASVSEADRERVSRLVRDFLDVVGIRDGPSHTEVIVTGEGPFIVESHDRLGGDKIFRLVELACGADLVSWCYEWPLGLMSEPSAPQPGQAACIRYLLVPPGRVRSISWPRPALRQGRLDHYELEISAGDEIRPLSSSLDRPGFVVTCGPTAAAAAAAASALIDSIRVEVAPVP